MKITFLLPLFIVCTIFIGTAQPAVLDSLQLELQKADTDSSRIYWMGRLVWHNLRYDLDSAQHYATTGRILAERQQRAKDINQFRHYQGLIHRIRSEYSAAIDCFKIVLRFHQEQKDTLRTTAPLFNLGVVYSYLGDYAKSMQYYQQELMVHKRYNQQPYIANSLNSIGNLYNNQQEYQKAYAAFINAKTIFEKENNKGQLATVFNNLGDNFNAMGQLDSAEIYALKSLQLDRELERPWGIGFSLALLTEIKREQKNWVSALNYANEALQIRRTTGHPKNIAYSLAHLANVQKELGQTSSAIKNTKEAIVIADSINALEILTQSYQLLAKLEAQQNNYQQAYAAQLAFQRHNDSLFNVDKSKAIEEIEVQYNLKEKEQEVQNLQRENKLKTNLATQERRSRMAWTIAALLLALLAAALTLWYRQRLYKNQLINHQKVSLQQSQISALEQQQKILAFAATLNAQEKERKRIAKDLHDSLGSLLATIRLHFKSIHHQTPTLHQSEAYLKTKSLLLQAGDEVRRISHNMMPDVLQLGLSTAIAELVEDLNVATPANIQFQQLGSCAGKITDQQSIMLYRITQELLQNALKHADAKNIWTQLICKAQQLQLIVEDDGKGFDKDTETYGLGLRSIRSRTEVINGHLQIDTNQTIGTTVIIVMPLK